MDLLEQLPFLETLPPVLREIALNLILVLLSILVVMILRWMLVAALMRPLRALVRRTASDIDDQLLDESLTPIRVAVLGFAVIFTVNLFHFGVEVQEIAETAGRTLMISAVFLFIIKLFEIVSLHPKVFNQVTGLTIPERLLPFLNIVFKYLIIALGAIFVLQELHFDVAALIASLGVVGIGISLASKDTVSNLFGFAAIVSDNPFKVGDFIKTPDVSGIVEHVGMRSTRVRQLDQALVTVPNNLLTNAIVLNWSRLEKRRLNITLTFTYSTTSEQMRAALKAITELLENTADVDPQSVIVHFVEFSASSLDVLVICQVLLADWRENTALKEKLNLEIMEIVESLGISFAFPSQSLYIEEMPGAGRNDDAASQKGERSDSDAGASPHAATDDSEDAADSGMTDR